jgi:hypothetical protein
MARMDPHSPRRLAALALLGAIAAATGTAAAQAPRFEVEFAPTLQHEPVTGRLVLIVAKESRTEPRYAVSPSGPALFGIDVEEFGPGEVAVVDDGALGYPMRLSELPAGDYSVQAVVNVYTQVKRADGHVLWLPVNDGRQATAFVAAGNLVSEPQRVHVEPGGGGEPVAVPLTRVLPPLARPADTEWVQRVTLQSRKLSEFWGRPIFVHATILLPRDFTLEKERRYPCIYALGHDVPFSFTTDPARAGERGALHPTTGLESGYDFFQAWRGDDFPRVVAISFEQQTPYFPDGYSVDSASNGPYGEAIVEEVIPELEKRFRLIAAPHARQLEGASTGGWSALALELQHPDFFGGAWVLQPDPIDFHRYQLVDLYEDANAFEVALGPFGKTERPFRRSVEGQQIWSVRELSLFEEVLGTRGRSGWQFAGWEAVFAPLDADGYPRPLWDRRTGAIDKEVVRSMRASGYDLADFTRRNWKELGPKLAGKLHLFAGDMDDFFLNLAVYRFEEQLKEARDPPSDAEFTYGRPKKGHSWHAMPWSAFVRRVAAAVERASPLPRERR